VNESKIFDALQGRHLLRFCYKGHLTPTTVEPYTYGENEAGHNALSAWLVRGETHETNPPFWRTYLETEMTGVEVLDDTFQMNRPGYNPNDRRFRFIRRRVSDPGAL
jgi:hypothetical protein